MLQQSQQQGAPQVRERRKSRIGAEIMPTTLDAPMTLISKSYAMTHRTFRPRIAIENSRAEELDPMGCARAQC
jgi:hypothetical protein